MPTLTSPTGTDTGVLVTSPTIPAEAVDSGTLIVAAPVVGAMLVIGIVAVDVANDDIDVCTGADTILGATPEECCGIDTSIPALWGCAPADEAA